MNFKFPLIMLPDDVESFGFCEVRKFEWAQVYRSKRFDFIGTENDFLTAGLAYRYCPRDRFSIFIHEADKANAARLKAAAHGKGGA